MSFEEQERALFDLLFDRTLRDNFCKDSIAALNQYELDEDEQKDFLEVRPDGLELDAKIRADLLLSHFCRSYPISFSIASSFDGGLEILKELIDTKIMRTASVERPTEFGNRLREVFNSFSYDAVDEQAKVSAILEAELGMCWTAASLKREVLDNGMPEIQVAQTGTDWASKLIKLAPYVCAAIIPGRYMDLKSVLCVSSDCDLWRGLNKTPLSASQRRKVLDNDDPRLFVARAYVSHVSRCEPVVDQKTAELSEGFASLFQHVNGSMSVEQILSQLKQIGAPEQMLEGVQIAFKQLLDTGMIEFT